MTTHGYSPRSSNMNMLMLFLAATAPIASLAYTTNNAYPHNSFKPAFVTPQQQVQRPVKYDLGLGKNGPVTTRSEQATKSTTTTTESTTAYETAQYWNEFESVNPLPNPSEQLRNAAQAVTTAATGTASNNSNNKKKNPRPNPRVMPKRFHRDDFAIQMQQQQQELPVMSTSNRRNFDVNTAWVEMLIHEQELKLVAAQA